MSAAVKDLTTWLPLIFVFRAGAIHHVLDNFCSYRPMAHVWFISFVCSRQAPARRLNRSAPEIAILSSGGLYLRCQREHAFWGRSAASEGRAARSIYLQRPRSEPCKMAQRQFRAPARPDRQHRMLRAQNGGHRMPPVLTRQTHKARKEAMSGIWRSLVPKSKSAIRSRQRTTTSTPNIISDRCARTRTGIKRICRDGHLRQHKLGDQL